MHIHGLQKLAMVDYPGKLAATVFTGGCDLRCPFCHNALLVTRLAETPEIPEREVLDFLSSRKGLLDGVVLTGGEPLLQPDAAEFLQAVRELGFAVKLDTNGCHPAALAEILEAGLADYVAMDVKNSRARYAETVGVPGFDLSPVEESVRLLRESGVDCEFRTPWCGSSTGRRIWTTSRSGWRGRPNTSCRISWIPATSSAGDTTAFPRRNCGRSLTG